MKVRWSRRAQRGVEEIFEWIDAEDHAAAVALLRLLKRSAKRLGRLPGLGRAGRVIGTRELVLTPYIVAYRVVREQLEVVRVLHASRKWPTKFSGVRRA